MAGILLEMPYIILILIQLHLNGYGQDHKLKELGNIYFVNRKGVILWEDGLQSFYYHLELLASLFGGIRSMKIKMRFLSKLKIRTSDHSMSYLIIWIYYMIRLEQHLL